MEGGLEGAGCKRAGSAGVGMQGIGWKGLCLGAWSGFSRVLTTGMRSACVTACLAKGLGLWV